MSRRFTAPLAAASLVLIAFASPASAQSDERPDRPLPAAIDDLKLATPATGDVSKLDTALVDASGEQTVIVRLVGDSVAEAPVEGGDAERAHKQQVEAEQDAFVARAEQAAPSSEVIAETQTALNAVFLEVDGAELEALAADPAVLRISRVVNYEMDLSETVPYIGATAVQNAGFDGSGVRVAVLDSGIDYTHIALGGSGDPAEYAANNPNIIEPGTFPTAKVVGGTDFVGSSWTGSTGPPEVPDPDPLDDGPGSGHGTHVADIIGGVGGVAPGIDLYAVKVCSSISTSCSGIALIQGMDYVVDPNGDGDTSDAMDVVNMSLGSNYGQSFDDDLSAAVDNASALGVLTVASSGNSADKPFITGTPGATSSALSVAQTQVPSAALQLLGVGGVNYPAVFQPWSAPLASAITGPLQYGDGAGGNLNGCAPFAPGSLTGKVVLVDRGACNFSLKIKTVNDAGGAAGIIGLIAPGAPFSGGDGGDGPITIPGYMISQADSNAIKAQLGTPATLDPVNQLPLVGQMVGSSSRGPNYQTHIIKPEIGAPGASVSAIAGTGNGTGPFGGTSGAAPMVSGSAALLLQVEPALSPVETKARLVGTGNTDIRTDPFTGLAPISRIGGGEVRVDAAVNTKLAAWDDDTLLPTLSFGHVDVSAKTTKVKKAVRVHNYGTSDMRLKVTPTFRYADDAATGAVQAKVKFGNRVLVRPGESELVYVELTIKGALLPGNSMNSGSQGANGDALTANEFDGYVEFDDGAGTAIHVPWQILPRRAAAVETDIVLDFRKGTDRVKLVNRGVGTAQNDVYSLLGVSPDLPEGTRGGQSPVPDLKAFGVNTFPVPAGFCSADASFLWSFAINTWERQTMAVVPGYYWIDLDTNQDGILDYAVFNWDLAQPLGAISDGRNVVWSAAYDPTGTFLTSAQAFFFTEHATVTGNTNMLICGEQIGLTGTDMLSTNVDVVSVYAYDNYFTGAATDQMGPFTITPLGEQYVGAPVDVPGKSRDKMTVTDFGPFPGNTPELGVMLFTNGDRGAGSYGGATASTEALIIPTEANKQAVIAVIGKYYN